MAKNDLGGRDRPKIYLCGHCASAARTKRPAESHRLCPGGACACGNADHKFDRAMAEVMARANRLPIDAIYTAHGRKRRVLTDEQREVATANLVRARAAQRGEQVA